MVEYSLLLYTATEKQSSTEFITITIFYTSKMQSVEFGLQTIPDTQLINRISVFIYVNQTIFRC